MSIILYALKFYAVYQLTYFFGAFAFPQIVGSIKMYKERPNLLFPMLLWTLIVIAASIAVYLFLRDYIVAYFIGLIIPFIITLRTKNFS